MTNTITRKQIRENLDNKVPMTIVEALPGKYFDDWHLPGAVNIPHDQVRSLAGEMLPDRNALIVVYCASTTCQNSRIATQTLQQMGYNNVFEYVEGKQHWLEAGYPVEPSQLDKASCG